MVTVLLPMAAALAGIRYFAVRARTQFVVAVFDFERLAGSSTDWKTPQPCVNRAEL